MAAMYFGSPAELIQYVPATPYFRKEYQDQYVPVLNYPTLDENLGDQTVPNVTFLSNSLDFNERSEFKDDESICDTAAVAIISSPINDIFAAEIENISNGKQMQYLSKERIRNENGIRLSSQPLLNTASSERHPRRKESPLYSIVETPKNNFLIHPQCSSLMCEADIFAQPKQVSPRSVIQERRILYVNRALVQHRRILSVKNKRNKLITIEE